MILTARPERDDERGLQLYSFDEVSSSEVADQYLRWLNDLEVTSPIGSPVLLQEKSEKYIEESFLRFTSENCKGFFIKDRTSGTFIGTVKIDKINLHSKSAECGILIGEKKLWGRGIASQCLAILLDYLFYEKGFNRVWGGTDEHNIGMQKVFLKLGFRKEGELRQANFIDCNYSDNLLYGLLRSEYMNREIRGKLSKNSY